MGGGRTEPAQHLRELEAREARHLHVEEDAVDLGLAQDPQPLGGGVGGQHLADPVVAGQQPGQLVEGRPFVVDDEDPQPRPLRRTAGHAWTPGANLGTRSTTRVPAPGAVSTTSP